jgi:hypothetical protein
MWRGESWAGVRGFGWKERKEEMEECVADVKSEGFGCWEPEVDAGVDETGGSTAIDTS